MNRRSQAIIGATLALLGVGAVALGYAEDESTVRYVADIMDDPAAHQRGTYTLLAIPQPHTLNPGTDQERPNPDRPDHTTHTTMETIDGRPTQVTYTLTVAGPDDDGISHWSLQKTLRVPGTTDVETPPPTNWTVDGPHHVFLIQGFPDAQGDAPVLWGVYDGDLRDPLQPKPSQFTGHLATTLPGGEAVPEGARVYEVAEYTAGCSSKFLPDDVAEEYDQDGDGYTD